MSRTVAFALALSVAVVSSSGVAQTGDVVAAVRQAIAQHDFARGDQLLADYRAAHGIDARALVAMSWLARGALAERRVEDARRYAEDAYRLGSSLLATRALDADSDLPTAIGAVIEVLAQADAERGARSEAIQLLQTELAKYRGTSIEKRIQKNINLLSLEGTVAPPLDLGEYIGDTPPPLASLKGRVVLLFFWAHWCPDCKAQAPILADVLARYKGRGLTIMAPTQRYGYVARGRAATADEENLYIDEVRRTYYPVLVGLPIPLSEANHRRYGVSSTPTLVLVDRAGFVRLYHPGKMSEAELDSIVRSLLDARGTRGPGQ